MDAMNLILGLVSLALGLLAVVVHITVVPEIKQAAMEQMMFMPMSEAQTTRAQLQLFENGVYIASILLSCLGCILLTRAAMKRS